jgi:hypothetical protein
LGFEFGLGFEFEFALASSGIPSAGVGRAARSILTPTTIFSDFSDGRLR